MRDCINDNKYIMILEMSEQTKASTVTISRCLKKRTQSNIIERVNSRKAGYLAIKSLYRWASSLTPFSQVSSFILSMFSMMILVTSEETSLRE